MNRRDFLRLTGLAAGAVAFGGASALATPEALDAPFAVGDVFTIAGYYAVHPITGQPTECLQDFIVTAVSATDVSFSPHCEDGQESLGFGSVDLLAGRA